MATYRGTQTAYGGLSHGGLGHGWFKAVVL
jgi:hypothetical protein